MQITWVSLMLYSLNCLECLQSQEIIDYTLQITTVSHTLFQLMSDIKRKDKIHHCANNTRQN